MLAHPYGYTRVMSSYYFEDDTDQGPPHNDDWRSERTRAEISNAD